MTIVSSTFLETEFGSFRVCYHESRYGPCASFSRGELSKGTPIVRLHSACLFSEAFHSLQCDCGLQLIESMKLIQKNKSGAIIYSYDEGMGIGLKKKIEAMEIQRLDKCDLVDSFAKLGFSKTDARIYKSEIQAMKDLRIGKNIQLFSGNPQKIKAVKGAGFNVTKKLGIDHNALNDLAKKELSTKLERLGYDYRKKQ